MVYTMTYLRYSCDTIFYSIFRMNKSVIITETAFVISITHVI